MLSGSVRLVSFVVLIATLSGCESFVRSDNAAAARRKMVGLTKEQVLVCMGIPQKKQEVGATEVWQYQSTDGSSDSYGDKHKFGTDTFSFGHSSKQSCSVNIVMTDDVVKVVHYNGARGGLLSPDEQCGYAIEHCVE